MMWRLRSPTGATCSNSRPNAADSASALVAELRRSNAKKIGLLYTDDAYGKDGYDSLRGELTKADFEIAGEQAIKPTDTDLTQPVTAMVEAKPDAIIVWTGAEQAMLVAAQSRSHSYPGALLFDAGAAGELFLGGTNGAAAENTTMVFSQTMVIDDVIATTPAKAARKQWFRDYTARFGGYYGYSSFAADAAQLIVDAALRSDSSVDANNRDALRDVLETSQMDGLSGPIRMTPDNHSGLMPQALTMLVARGGRWRLAS